MKVTLSALFLLLASAFAWAQEGEKSLTDPTEASYSDFDHKIHNFGIVEYAGDGKCTFNFKNTGTTPLVIKNVKTSCGCTTPGYSKEPVQPGGSGFVTAKYDTNREGTFHKTLTVVFMDDSQVVLTIKGTVKPKPATTTEPE
ncbi:MAG: DUF1573 domain-containing protein [Bacteroidetes bacterium]|jgi:hypothetical protein|nr:DUF1573 domain-containing protein [Bacteroidota bacterium]